MVIQSTGAISLTHVQGEMGGTTPIALSEYYNNAASGYAAGVVGVPNTGSPISVGSFYGKAKPTAVPSGPGLWVDASDISTITKDASNKVSVWKDKSGNGRDFSMATYASQPTYSATGFNTKPCMTMGTTINLARAANTMGTLASSSTTTVYVVAGCQSYPWTLCFSNWMDASGNGSVNRFHLSMRDTYTNLLTLYINGTKVASAGATADGGKYVCGFVFAGQNVSSVLSLNGVASAFTPSVALPSSVGSSTSMFILGDPRSGYYPSSPLAEVVAYDRALSASERVTLETYLKTKYGIA